MAGRTKLLVEAFSSFSEPFHIPLMNSPHFRLQGLPGTSCRVRLLHAQGSCKPIPIHRQAGYHHHHYWIILICQTHQSSSPITKRTLSQRWTLPRPRIYAKGSICMGMHLPLSDGSRQTKLHQAYLDHPTHYNRVHALIRRERTVSAIHGRACALQGCRAHREVGESG